MRNENETSQQNDQATKAFAEEREIDRGRIT